MNLNTKQGFSLIEVVIALGIFAFCIVGIVGLLPIAANSVKSVSQESNANNIAESIAGFWQVAPLNSLTSGGNFTMGNFTVGETRNETFYYDNNGGQVDSNDPKASLQMVYDAQVLDVDKYPGSFTVNLTFTWPPNASANSTTATTRTFNYIFTK